MATPSKPEPGSPPLEDRFLQGLAEHGERRAFADKTVVIREGDTDDSFYVVLTGRVKVYVADDEGRELILDVLGPGTFFGEFALDGTARSASVACLEPSTFAVLERSALREAIASNPDFTLEFLLKLIKRMRNATEAVKTLGLMDVYSRFVKLINSLAVEKEGVKTIPERLTQQDLADRIGASRESVSRIIGDLTMGGYLSVKHQLITINKKLPRRW